MQGVLLNNSDDILGQNKQPACGLDGFTDWQQLA